MNEVAPGFASLHLSDRQRTEGVVADDLISALSAVGTAYRVFRFFQYGEEVGPLSDFGFDEVGLGTWLREGTRPAPPQDRLGSGAFSATLWAGALSVRDAKVGSLELLLAAFGGGVGIAAALGAAAKLLESIVVAPGKFREAWAKGREADAAARLKEAEARALEA
jgi:hypothetical protein